MYISGHKANKHHLKQYGSPSEFGYKDFIPMFKAERFDADEWAELFEKSGAKYAGPVAEHADGFAMWSSDLTKWNAANMGPKRDVVGELAKTIRKRGLKFIATFHHQWLWGWYPTDDETVDASNPEYSGLYGQRVPRSAFGMNPDPRPNQGFQKTWLGKAIEVIDRYQPDMLYFDSRLDIIEDEYKEELLSYYCSRASNWKKEVVVTYKDGLPAGVGVVDVERGRMSTLKDFEWQTDDSIDWNSWCHVQSPSYKSANGLVDELVDIVSKNGNLLLSITPKANGEIPDPVKERLLEIGRWLKINGEAIYCTRPWKVFGEGPTQVEDGPFGERKTKEFTAKDIRFTTKGNTLYAICLDWPKGKVTIHSLSKALHKDTSRISEVRLLGSDSKLRWVCSDHGLTIEMPDAKPCDYAYAFKITFDGQSHTGTSTYTHSNV